MAGGQQEKPYLIWDEPHLRALSSDLYPEVNIRRVLAVDFWVLGDIL